MKRLFTLVAVAMFLLTAQAGGYPYVTDRQQNGDFPLVTNGMAAAIVIDEDDYAVVGITAGMLADDVERVTTLRPRLIKSNSRKTPRGTGAVVVAGTVGKSRLIDELIRKRYLNADAIKGKWESFIMTTVKLPARRQPVLVIAGSDRRGTAFGLTSLSEAIGVSPWYWWADVHPQQKRALFVQSGTFRQEEPSVQYRGIFINDERFGGWARWAEQNYDKESGKVGPKTYRRVFELLLRLKANYLWPAMHPGTQAFNDDPENARLADDYAIVMGSSHCEQMLRNNEGEWRAVNERAQREGIKGLGDFNYITNRKAMQDYWEERVRTNGRYENTYTLGLRGIHDYPMEGANTTQERVKLMQQAIADQRDMLRRNIHQPIEQIPQVLCTYEEVLDAYHHGLQIPDDVTLLWSDDKHGYCRNLSNPAEQRRAGGAGIYYHLSYHGDPASWIWLSPLSPAFLSTELTKAYTFGARKIWVFNVGDIKPAEKEISFVMDLAWDVNRWQPAKASQYTRYWAEKTFGPALAQDIADLQSRYYQLQAAGKDAHVWFVDYTEKQVSDRVVEARSLAAEAELLAERVPERLKDAYFELVSYPIRGAALINEYQLLARRSMVCATRGDSLGAMADANRVRWTFDELNRWTRHYNEELQNGKWREFFNWQPYHWFRSERIEQPVCTPELFTQAQQAVSARFLPVSDVLSANGLTIKSETSCDIPLWMNALTPIHHFSKAPADNLFCHVTTDNDSFDASATPINNVWHAPYVGPMWSRVGTLHLREGTNRITITDVKPDARIDQIFIGLWPPFAQEPRLRINAGSYHQVHDSREGSITTVQGLGFHDGVLVQPFNTPSYDMTDLSAAPSVTYKLNLGAADRSIEIRTLPTLHVYDGREVRYAVQLGHEKPVLFSIHADDFCAEWRWNVLRGYSSRSIPIPANMRGSQELKVYFLDPGVVLQEIAVQ